MKKGFFVYCERALVTSSLAFAAITLMGVKSCDLTQDYFFATQAKIAASPTATPDGTVGTLTPTPTGSATVEATDTPKPLDTLAPAGTGTATPTPGVGVTGTPNGTTTPLATAGVQESNIFTQLKGLDNPDWKDTPSPFATLGADAKTIAVNSESLATNWLGNIYNKDANEAANASSSSSSEPDTKSLDSDGDGFTDALEIASGTNPNDPNDFPRWVITTKLQDLKKGIDDDLDGLTNEQEKALGTNPEKADSDRDGFWDGNEVLSGTSPLDQTSKPIDSDGDGLSDEVEKKLHLDPHNPDTDGDGLSDGMEQALGTNPFVKDTDGDGILDGKEVEMNSNPLVAEGK